MAKWKWRISEVVAPDDEHIIIELPDSALPEVCSVDISDTNNGYPRKFMIGWWERLDEPGGEQT